MYPVLFTIPGLDWPISSFGAMMALGFLVGYWISLPRMKEEGLDPEDAANLLMVIMLATMLAMMMTTMTMALTIATFFIYYLFDDRDNSGDDDGDNDGDE